MGEWRYSSTILDLVRFAPQLLYPRGNRSQYPLDTRLGGPQNQSGCYGEEKNLTPARNQTLAIQLVLTEVFQLLSNCSNYLKLQSSYTFIIGFCFLAFYIHFGKCSHNVPNQNDENLLYIIFIENLLQKTYMLSDQSVIYIVNMSLLYFFCISL
jgi:hypothetical protein